MHLSASIRFHEPRVLSPSSYHTSKSTTGLIDHLLHSQPTSTRLVHFPAFQPTFGHLVNTFSSSPLSPESSLTCLGPSLWNNPKGLSVNWALGNRRLKGGAPIALACQLRRWSHWLRWGKTKRTKLEFSGWDLRPYILLYMFVPICIRSTDDCSRMFQILVAWGRSVHQARPWSGDKAEHKATARWWQNGRKEVGHSHALHGDEWSEECMWHNVKRKEKHRDSVAVIG